MAGRQPLSRDRILEAALALADEGGIESLSMRKLGQALGVEAMSLYNHVANKDDILNSIVDLVVAEFELPVAGDDWEEALRKTAISGHEALLRHRWASTLVMSTNAVSYARVRYIDAVLRLLREAGFSADTTYHAYHAIDSHILGFTLWELGHTPNPEALASFGASDFADLAAKFLEALPAADYPYFAEHVHQHLADSGPRDVSEFEFGLELILEGLKRMR